jgi:sporulation protein YlmC with PRC-barrel domain
MLIKNKQLKKIEVETLSGEYLGQVADFELETDTSIIEKYHVKTKLSLVGLFENKLIINKEQIINFDEQKMVVEDNVIKAKELANKVEEEVNKLEGTEPAITSKRGD